MHYHIRDVIRHRSLQGILCLGLLSLFTAAAWGYSSGPLDGYCGDPPNFNNCTACHSSYPVNSGDGLLELLGLPEAYQPDSTYGLIIALMDTGQIRWGFEMTSILNNGNQGGILDPIIPIWVQLSEGPGVDRDYVKHTALGTFEDSLYAVWVVSWTAPPVGADSVHFYLAGNAANGNGTNQGDYIYTISVHVPEFQVGVKDAPASLPAVNRLVPAYPNPFNPSTAICYELSNPAFVELNVFDTAGNLITTLAKGWKSAGTHQTAFDGSGLPSGIYIYRLTVGDFTAAGKLVMLK